jgi:hypothetical protein
MLQMMLLKMSGCDAQLTNTSNTVVKNSGAAKPINPQVNSQVNSSSATPAPGNTVENRPVATPTAVPPVGWDKVVQNLNQLNDPLVASIFKQGKLLSYDKETGNLQVSFPGELNFFSEQLDSSKKIWQPFLATIFDDNIKFSPVFDKQQEKKSPANTINNSGVSGATSSSNNNLNGTENKPAISTNSGATQKKQPSSLIDVIDKQKWQKTHNILSVFPGKITQIN